MQIKKIPIHMSITGCLEWPIRYQPPLCLHPCCRLRLVFLVECGTDNKRRKHMMWISAVGIMRSLFSFCECILSLYRAVKFSILLLLFSHWHVVHSLHHMLCFHVSVFLLTQVSDGGCSRSQTAAWGPIRVPLSPLSPRPAGIDFFQAIWWWKPSW